MAEPIDADAPAANPSPTPIIDLPPLSRLNDAALLPEGPERARLELTFMEQVCAALLKPMLDAYEARDWARLSHVMATGEDALLAAYRADPTVLARALVTLCGDIVTAAGRPVTEEEATRG